MKNVNHIVAFLDILGTKDKVRKHKFSDMEMLDFSNPVALTAMQVPNVQFAVFSDSVIISAPCPFVDDFLYAIQFICGQWFADLILVRGGISAGQINWVDFGDHDKIWKQQPNLSFSRVYGKALIEAYETESKSGPGAVIYVHDNALKVCTEIINHILTINGINYLIWACEREVTILEKYFISMSKDKSTGIPQKHVKHTLQYFQWLINNKKYRDDIYDNSKVEP